jgi:hypothetical protein
LLREKAGMNVKVAGSSEEAKEGARQAAVMNLKENARDKPKESAENVRNVKVKAEKPKSMKNAEEKSKKNAENKMIREKAGE